MRKILSASFWGLFGSTAAAKPDQSSLRTINTGSVIGAKGPNKTHVWRGIPYAKPPVGKLRWRAPRPPAPFGDVLLATKRSPVCTQYKSPLGNASWFQKADVIGQEDCLYLSVWAPQFSANDVPTGNHTLPVMLWIHGGGNSVGYGDAYYPFNLVQNQQVIVVTINYRLGPLGWFPHPAIRSTAENPEDASGVYGLLDIIAALQWVQRNIDSFGGNPDNVTIFGESAGGANVFMLLASPLAKGLFHRAIAQSARAYLYPIEQAEELQMAKSKGHPNSSSEIVTRLYAQKNRSSIAEARRKMVHRPTDFSEFLWAASAEDLIRTYDRSPTGMLFFPAYLRDGYVVHDRPLAQTLADPSQCNTVPLITGTNRDEQKTFLALNKRLVSRRMGLRIRDLGKYNTISQYFSEAWKILSVDNIARAYSTHTSVWGYRFDWDDLPKTWLVDFPNLLGAGHALEMSFVFGEFKKNPVVPFVYNRKNKQSRETLSATMMNFWAQFAKQGNPNSKNQLHWKEWGTSQQVLLFDSGANGVRMHEQSLETAMLKNRLAADASLTAKEKCYIYNGIFRFSDFYDADEFDSLGCDYQ